MEIKIRKLLLKSFSIIFTKISSFWRGSNDWLVRLFYETVEKEAFYYHQIQMSDIGNNMHIALFEIFTCSGYDPRS